MKIYAISDLHLSFTSNKPMDVFGPAWSDHAVKIKNNWEKTVREEDTVLIPGDISWAMTLDEAMEDLCYIGSLPGTKVLVRGNHDYWWSSISKVRRALPPQTWAIQNDALDIGDISICGTRGWLCPGSREFTRHDQTVYEREVHRLALSLRRGGQKRKWVMLHYPPVNERHEVSRFIELMQEHGVERCIYGHLHGKSHQTALLGKHFGIEFSLVACDYLDFQPLLLPHEAH